MTAFIRVSTTPDKILDRTNITLTCVVNLPATDIEGSGVMWTLPDGTQTSVGRDGSDNGEYHLHLQNLQPGDDGDSGDYTCTVVTVTPVERIEVNVTETIDVKGMHWFSFMACSLTLLLLLS